MLDSRLTRRQWLSLAVSVIAAPLLGRLEGASVASAQTVRPATTPTSSSRGILAQSGGTLRSAEWLAPPTLDPAGAINSYIVLYGLGETLTRITVDGRIEPWLAESVSPVDPLRWRVKLRSGITFSNGRALDAGAAKSSLERSVAKRPASAAQLNLASVEVVDGLTFDIVTARPIGAMPSNLAGSIAIIHDAEAAASVGDDAFASAPVLTGPYIPTAFRVRESVTARRNDTYWGGTPGLAGFDFKAVSDANARLAALLAGDVNIARPIPAVATAQARAGGFNVVSGDEASMYSVYFNNTRAPLDELAVRQAVNLLIDRDALVSGVFEGSAVAANGPYPTYFPFADQTPPPYDPVQAANLLDGAGWLLGSDGVRRRNGQPLAFSLMTYPQLAEVGLLAVVIQASLQSAGIQAEIRQVEQIVEAMNTGDFEAAVRRYGSTPTADPGFVLNAVYASTAADNKHLNYKSARLDDVTARLNVASDPAQRRELALEAQKVMQDEVPAAFLASPRSHVALSPRVQGFEWHPSSDYYYVNHRLSLA